MKARTRWTILTLATLLLVLPATALAAPTTTVERTMLDCDGDDLLDMAFGERHLIFPATPEQEEQDPCEERPDGDEPRLPPSASIINFLQLSDFQMVDEESPGRVEFLDGTQRVPGAQPFSAAYRPQESLTTQVTEAMVRQARNMTSPVTGRPLDLAILTGDNADSQQFNETRWFIDILDGTTGPGNPDPEMQSPEERGRDRKINPDSGIPTDAPNCGATPGTRYDGVRDSGEPGVNPDFGYYEPDRSSGEGGDGDGYLPDPDKNQAEVGRRVTVRDFPGLFERANEPFEAVGLDLPWYTAFGNHDALIQGNSPEAYGGPFGASGEHFNPVMHLIATGCLKVKQPAPAGARGALTDAADEITEQLREGPPDQSAVDALQDQIDAIRASTAAPVPPDPRRCYVAKDDNAALTPPQFPPGPCSTGSWIRQHFRTTGTPLGHGLAPSLAADCAKYGEDADECRAAAADLDAGLGRPPQAVANHDGYYSFVPKAGLRFVVLDTVTDECGSEFCSEGSVDGPQFEWLRQQITDAKGLDQYVLVFSHHTLRTIRFPTSDHPSEDPVHYGQRVDRRGGQPQNPGTEKTLEGLFCENDNVLAHVAGHEHENYVERHECGTDVPAADCSPCENPRFWHISTAAHIDWPQQSRAIELVNLNGELAFVLTILDHDGAANPGGPPPPREAQGQAPDDVLRLASIGREIAYNDYQGSRGARGGRQDRNVILPTARLVP